MNTRVFLSESSGDVPIADVECGKFAYILELVFLPSTAPWSRAPFCWRSPLDGFPVADTLAKEACDGRGVAREMGQNGFGILYAGEVDDRGV